MNPATYTYKLGTHRGARRLWIEGKRLSAAGFERGVAYTLTVASGDLALKLDPSGDRHVAGTAARPIVDILTRAFGDDVQRVQVTFAPGSVIARADAS